MPCRKIQVEHWRTKQPRTAVCKTIKCFISNSCLHLQYLHTTGDLKNTGSEPQRLRYSTGDLDSLRAEVLPLKGKASCQL